MLDLCHSFLSNLKSPENLLKYVSLILIAEVDTIGSPTYHFCIIPLMTQVKWIHSSA